MLPNNINSKLEKDLKEWVKNSKTEELEQIANAIGAESSPKEIVPILYQIIEKADPGNKNQFEKAQAFLFQYLKANASHPELQALNALGHQLHVQTPSSDPCLLACQTYTDNRQNTFAQSHLEDLKGHLRANTQQQEKIQEVSRTLRVNTQNVSVDFKTELHQANTRNKRRTLARQVAQEIKNETMLMCLDIPTSDFATNGPKTKALGERVSQISDMVQENILYSKDPKELNRNFDFYFKLAQECQKNNDFCSACAIAAGLENDKVKRLGIYKKYSDQNYHATVGLLNPDESYKQYRDEVKKAQGVVFPFIPYHSKDVTFINEGNKGKDKQVLLGRGAQAHVRLQKEASRIEVESLEPSRTNFSHYLKQPHLHDDIMWSRSLEIKSSKEPLKSTLDTVTDYEGLIKFSERKRILKPYTATDGNSLAKNFDGIIRKLTLIEGNLTQDYVEKTKKLKEQMDKISKGIKTLSKERDASPEDLLKEIERVEKTMKAFLEQSKKDTPATIFNDTSRTKQINNQPKRHTDILEGMTKTMDTYLAGISKLKEDLQQIQEFKYEPVAPVVPNQDKRSTLGLTLNQNLEMLNLVQEEILSQGEEYFNRKGIYRIQGSAADQQRAIERFKESPERFDINMPTDPNLLSKLQTKLMTNLLEEIGTKHQIKIKIDGTDQSYNILDAFKSQLDENKSLSYEQKAKIMAQVNDFFLIMNLSERYHQTNKMNETNLSVVVNPCLHPIDASQDLFGTERMPAVRNMISANSPVNPYKDVTSESVQTYSYNANTDKKERMQDIQAVKFVTRKRLTDTIKKNPLISSLRNKAKLRSAASFLFPKTRQRISKSDDLLSDLNSLSKHMTRVEDRLSKVVPKESKFSKFKKSAWKKVSTAKTGHPSRFSLSEHGHRKIPTKKDVQKKNTQPKGQVKSMVSLFESKPLMGVKKDEELSSKSSVTKKAKKNRK